MDISFEHDIEQWTRSLRSDVAWVVPYAAAAALSRTASRVKEHHRQMLPIIFDRPTRYTLNGLQVTPATARNLVASVWFKDSPRSRQHYLVPQVEGGSRPHKRFEYWLIQKGIMQPHEFAVPASGLKLNAYGNMSPGTITQILSQLQASPDAMQRETARSRKRKGAARNRYFVPQPGSRLRRGIWRRVGKSRIEPVLIFVSSVTYAKRYHFHQLSMQEADRVFPEEFERSLVDMIRRKAG